MIFYEDMAPGTGLSAAGGPVDKAEIVEFARQWDPMPFHTDGSSAPGIYILAYKQRLLHQLPQMAVLASFGYDEVRFHEPVKPGDTLSLALEWVSRRESTSKPHTGIVTLRLSLLNQRNAVVLSHLDTVLVRRRTG